MEYNSIKCCDLLVVAFVVFGKWQGGWHIF